MEAEVMLAGNWKNFEELEDNVNLDELSLLFKAARDREHRAHKFAAALKGIDIDEGEKSDGKEAFDRVQRRLEARMAGVSEEAFELDEMGLDIIVEE